MFFVQSVPGGEHTILIVGWYIRDVMEVASSAFRPRAAEHTRRNRNLIPARPYDRLEGDRVAADPDAARRIVERSVVERCNGGPPDEPMLPSNSGAIQLAIPLVADSRQTILIREVAA